MEGQRIVTFGNKKIPKGVELRRTYDRIFTDKVEHSNPVRLIGIDLTLENDTVTVKDERGLQITMPLPERVDGVLNRKKMREVFSKLGNTVYRLDSYTENLSPEGGFTPSALTAFRRNLIEELDRLNRITYPYGYRRKEDLQARFPYQQLTFAENVANPVAESFYRSHGVTDIQPALEVSPAKKSGTLSMTCRHCILREMGRCLQTTDSKPSLPLTLSSGPHRFTLRFNCNDCEMQLFYNSSEK